MGQCGSSLRGNSSSAGSSRAVTSATKRKLAAYFKHPNRIPDLNQFQALLRSISEKENLLLVRNNFGFNLLEQYIAEDNVTAVRIILDLVVIDLNSGACSLPLHIACLNGSLSCVKELIKRGARTDVKAPMCWPGPHFRNCDGITRESEKCRKRFPLEERPIRRKRRNAMDYALRGDHPLVMRYLIELRERVLEHARGVNAGIEPEYEKQPVEVAVHKKAWGCCDYLTTLNVRGDTNVHSLEAAPIRTDKKRQCGVLNEEDENDLAFE